MKYCSHCANELLDEAVICPKCGCAVTDTPQVTKDSKKPVSKKVIILSCIGGFVLILAIFIAAVLIPTDITLDDFTAKPNRITALVKFGLPRDLFDEEWVYDGISFHGIEADYLSVDFDEGSYTIMEFDDEDRDELADLLVDECDYEKNALGAYYYFSYKNIDITAQSDCSYISLEP